MRRLRCSAQWRMIGIYHKRLEAKQMNSKFDEIILHLQQLYIITGYSFSAAFIWQDSYATTRSWSFGLSCNSAQTMENPEATPTILKGRSWSGRAKTGTWRRLSLTASKSSFRVLVQHHSISFFWDWIMAEPCLRNSRCTCASNWRCRADCVSPFNS